MLLLKSCRGAYHNHTAPRYRTCLLIKRRLYDNNSPYTAGDGIVRSFAAKPESRLSLSDIIHYTGSTDEKMREYGIFLWNELPVRISHRIDELSTLPYNLSNAQSIRELRELYTHSFHLFRMLESPNDDESESLFINQMMQHFNALKPATILLANALNHSDMVIPECPFLNGFLDRFHRSRIGTRLLTGQYITCLTDKRNNKTKNKSNVLGLIDFECSPKHILETAIDDAQYLCHNNFGKCPAVRIRVSGDHNNNITFPYITSDLHYIFFELMKNSMRAVCEKYIENDEDDMPDIDCVIVAKYQQKSDDVTVKISDQGDGISKENIDKIWDYAYTTIREPDNVEEDDINLDNKAPMHGFGYGLPMSRLYARYFGGDLKVLSMDGYGTDAFIYLNWLKPDDVKPLTGQYDI